MTSLKNRKKKGIVVWFTGLPCSGKTTLSELLKEKLETVGLRVQLLDGDIMRKTISRDLGFSREEREKNIERAAHIANMLSENGVIVIAAFISPYKKNRQFARSICNQFIEIHLKCDIEVCMKRDVKGMYKRALAGEILDFTGVNDPYEEPEKPDIILETDKHAPQESVEDIIKYLAPYFS